MEGTKDDTNKQLKPEWIKEGLKDHGRGSLDWPTSGVRQVSDGCYITHGTQLTLQRLTLHCQHLGGVAEPAAYFCFYLKIRYLLQTRDQGDFWNDECAALTWRKVKGELHILHSSGSFLVPSLKFPSLIPVGKNPQTQHWLSWSDYLWHHCNLSRLNIKMSDRTGNTAHVDCIQMITDSVVVDPVSSDVPV